MFSADSGVVWAVQCFALLTFIIPFVFLISCTLWEMIQHNHTCDKLQKGIREIFLSFQGGI